MTEDARGTALDRPSTRVGAYALCVDADDRILLVRASDGTDEPARWTLPGGGLDWGEHPAAAVVRELREETGLEGQVGPVAGVFSWTYLRSDARPRDSAHLLGIVYRVEITGGELRDEAAGSSDAAAWVSRDEASALPVMGLVDFALPLAAEGRP